MSKIASSSQTARFYWQYAKRYPFYVWSIALLLPVTLLVHQFLPQLVIASMLDKLSRGDFEHGQLLEGFGMLLALYAALRIISATIMWRWIIIFLDRLEANVAKDMANTIFKHLLLQSPQFHASHFSGTLVSQTAKFITGYNRLSQALAMQFLPLVLSFIFTAIILLPKAPYFVVVLFIFCIIYMLITAKATRKVRQKSASDAKAQSQQTGQLADSMTNIIAIKSFSSTTEETRRFKNITENTRQKSLEHTSLDNKRQLYFSGLTSGITSCSVVLAVAGVVLFDANIAVAFLVLDYSANIVSKLWQFSSSTLRDVNRGFGEAHDMTNILQTPATIVDPKKPQKSRIKNGAISFNAITFGHDDAKKALFKDFTLTIKPGEKIGLVGVSGAGKTTLTKLLMRFSDVQSGVIAIDDQPILAITQDDLRKNIAYVPQEPMLFHRSIKENIRYGNPLATDKDVFRAARQAHASEFINELPNGYDTQVGERGVKLSGGQRQRIAIARALLKKAPILVLDEATSALDSESETLIQESLQQLMKNRTTIVVAHRLSTIQKMDRIIVLKNGAIVEDGSHAQLLKKNGGYASLWKHQSGGFLLDE